MGFTISNQSRKLLLITSLLLNLGAAIYFIRKVYIIQNQTAYVPPPKLSYYLKRNELFDKLTADSNDIIFLGNSLTQYFELAELFKNIHVKNRGIHGDDIEGVLKRLKPVLDANAKKIFIELGSNDLDIGHSKAKLVADYSRLIDTLKQACPRSKLYIQSLMPTAASSLFAPSYCSPQRNVQIREVNAALEMMAKEKNTVFLNFYRHFEKNGFLNPAYGVDGVHLSGEAYLLWTKLLKPYVDE